MTSPNDTTPAPRGIQTDETPEAFWERVYRGKTGPSAKRPSSVLHRFIEGRQPTSALELGCARGDDAIWLASQGWTVTGIDISETALQAARVAAAEAGVSDRVQFAQHDLDRSFPEGRFDLVIAMFLESPLQFGRASVLRKAAGAVASGGLLLIASHGSRAPWSWAAPDKKYPTAGEELASLDLAPPAWRELFVGSISRQARGPNGETAEVLDTVIAIERH